MKPKFVIIGILFSVLLLSGCISQEFTQKVGIDGTSIIEDKLDFNSMTGFYKELGFNSEDALRNNLTSIVTNYCDKIATKDKTIGCVADGLTITLSRNFTSKEGYYTFEANDGVPYKTYKLTINKIPMEKFGKAAQGLKFGTYFDGSGIAKDIDLRKTDENAVSAQGLAGVPGLQLEYSVEIPGEMTSATAGNYSAKITDNKATFNVVDVMASSAPLVIESKELNVFLIVVVVGVIVLLLLAFVFFSFKANNRNNR